MKPTLKQLKNGCHDKILRASATEQHRAHSSRKRPEYRREAFGDTCLMQSIVEVY